MEAQTYLLKVARTAEAMNLRGWKAFNEIISADGEASCTQIAHRLGISYASLRRSILLVAKQSGETDRVIQALNDLFSSRKNVQLVYLKGPSRSSEMALN